MRWIALSLAASLAACASAGGVRPLPMDWPAWQQARAESVDAISKLRADLDPAVAEFASSTLQLADELERKEKATLAKRLETFRSYPVKWASADDLKRRAQYTSAAHMFRLYGNLLPSAFNGKFPKHAAGPMKVWLSDKDYDDRYAPHGRALVEMLKRLQKEHGLPVDDLVER